MLRKFATRLFSKEIQAQVKSHVDLAVRVLDDHRDRLYSSDRYPRDRHAYDREEVLQDALEAWRINPLARRIVELVTQYVVGGGLSIESKHVRTNAFLQEWWNHRLNNMPMRIYEWCDELTRSGELFITMATDPSGMSYLRAIPAIDIQEIETSENDLDQELFIYEKINLADSIPETSLGPGGQLRGRRWTAYNPDADNPTEPVILHYAVNKPVGGLHGESDLAPILRWLSRYAAWLEDRARLNRYRQSFIYTVTSRFTNEAERLQRQAQLNMDPPNPGSILVIDESETWNVLSPQLASFEAAEDGLALKKMVAVGSGNPLHFLAEPESATRTTAEASGGPTYRHYQQRQTYFLWLVQDLARAAIRRRKYFDRLININEPIQVTAADISSRDNTELAKAAKEIIAAFAQLRQAGLIDDAEFLRIAYRFAGEAVDIQDLLARGKKGGATHGSPLLPEEQGNGDADSPNPSN